MGAKAHRKGGLRKALVSGRRFRGFTLTEILAVMAILSLIIVSLFTMFGQGTETWRLSGARTEAYLKARQILEMMAREIKGAVVITTPCGPDACQAPSRADFRGFNGDNPGEPGSPSNRVFLPGWRKSRTSAGREQALSDQIYFVTPRGDWKQQLVMIGYWIEDEEGDTAAPTITNGVPRNSKDDVFERYCVFEQGVAPLGQRWFDFSEPGGAGSTANHEVALSIRQLDIKYFDYDATGGLRPYDAWDSRPDDCPGPLEQKGTTKYKDDDDKLPVAVRITITVGDKDDIIKGVRLSTIVYLENAARR